MSGEVSLRWLGERRPAKLEGGVTWGVPWAEGALQRDEPLALYGADGLPVPVQSWPAAYWPDGSVKWTAHAAVFGGEPGYRYSLRKGAPAKEGRPLSVVETEGGIEIDTGVITCRLNKSGPVFVRELVRGGRRVCSGGRLVGVRETSSVMSGAAVVMRQPFVGEVAAVEVEQRGPLRAVVKLSGRHVMDGAGSGGGRRWLPFVVRMYLYAGSESIRLTHSFVYDGNPHQDFIKTGWLIIRRVRFRRIRGAGRIGRRFARIGWCGGNAARTPHTAIKCFTASNASNACPSGC